MGNGSLPGPSHCGNKPFYSGAEARIRRFTWAVQYPKVADLTLEAPHSAEALTRRSGPWYQQGSSQQQGECRYAGSDARELQHW